MKPRTYSTALVFFLAPECNQLDKMANATKDFVSSEETTIVFLNNFVTFSPFLCLCLPLPLSLSGCVCVYVCVPPGYHRNPAALGRAVAD